MVGAADGADALPALRGEPAELRLPAVQPQGVVHGLRGRAAARVPDLQHGHHAEPPHLPQEAVREGAGPNVDTTNLPVDYYKIFVNRIGVGVVTCCSIPMKFPIP